MGGLRRGIREVWDRSEDQMRRQWLVWVLALALYGFAGLLLLTRVRIPTVLHLLVLVMAAAVFLITLMRVEWGILALAVIFPFARPGITIGNPKAFQISGFNFAIAGVTVVYVLRYVMDVRFASLGPFVRRTRIDRNFLGFALLIILSSLWSLNLNTAPRTILTTMVFLKEHILYFIWFYLLITLLRKPEDLRQFAMFFAVAGLMASIVGMATRFTGGAMAITAGTVGENLGAGAGGRMRGGWLGLGHPNMFAAMLLMTMPLWFFVVNHLKHGIRRLMAEAAVINGFLGILFTYSRSAWIGTTLGIGLVGLADRKSLRRIVMFVIVFSIIAQTVVVLTTDMNLAEVVVNRVLQLEGSTFSGRPDIYASVIRVIKAHPFMGVGMGAIPAHAPPTPMGWVPANAHNVYLAYAAEAGLPAAILFVILFARILLMSVGNVRAVGQVPGYGFIALGSCGALLGLAAQTMFVHIFTHRILGFGFYAVAAIVVVLNRMIREGLFDGIESAEPGARSARGAWIGS